MLCRETWSCEPL